MKNDELEKLFARHRLSAPSREDIMRFAASEHNESELYRARFRHAVMFGWDAACRLTDEEVLAFGEQSFRVVVVDDSGCPECTKENT